MPGYSLCLLPVMVRVNVVIPALPVMVRVNVSYVLHAGPGPMGEEGKG